MGRRNRLCIGLVLTSLGVACKGREASVGAGPAATPASSSATAAGAGGIGVHEARDVARVEPAAPQTAAIPAPVPVLPVPSGAASGAGSGVAPDKEPAAAEAPLPSGADPWCIVLGGYPLDAFARAQATVVTAREKGIAGAAVFDARDFATFSWGELVVVGEAVEGKDGARARAAELKKAWPSSFAKRCPPHQGQPRPITSPSEIRPLFPLGSEPVSVPTDGKAPWASCFAWSPKDQRLACYEMEVSMSSGGWAKIGVEDAEPIALKGWESNQYFHVFDDRGEYGGRLDEAHRLAVRKLLEGAAFVALPPPDRAPWMRPITPKHPLRWADSRVSVAWTRVSERIVDEEGTWNDHSDTFEIQCSGSKWTWLETTTHDDHPKVFIGLLPGRRLLLEWSDTWMIWADGGRSIRSEVFDLEECKAAKGTDTPQPPE